ncbi:hypothetical protein GCM10010168_20560 [Actinoplanes ianthinogenes]|uniref:PRC-barrel domain-containing protein n=1 Tax=Actinoplanes ianthinogenes TaxID=122358 RepID=A0ABN6CR66_9ACTN|nr:hypothetical protein Aiant_83540 [Actinoplanes ianthinogenes]GGR03545.1 hypothetical protein GCM10010168_20560 [Actinoplanes ianthinogenes]
MLGKVVAGRGRIADIVVDPDTMRITAVVVVKGPWGRLLGYERDEVRGPWLLEHFARLVLRRDSAEIPWDEVPAEIRGD